MIIRYEKYRKEMDKRCKNIEYSPMFGCDTVVGKRIKNKAAPKV